MFVGGGGGGGGGAGGGGGGVAGLFDVVHHDTAFMRSKCLLWSQKPVKNMLFGIKKWSSPALDKFKPFISKYQKRSFLVIFGSFGAFGDHGERP